MAKDGLSHRTDESEVAIREALLDAAERHGLATEGAEMAWGDVEELFRAAFDLLTTEQRGRFWDDRRVAEIVRDCPEYEAIATAVYGAHRGGDGTVGP